MSYCFPYVAGSIFPDSMAFSMSWVCCSGAIGGVALDGSVPPDPHPLDKPRTANISPSVINLFIFDPLQRKYRSHDECYSGSFVPLELGCSLLRKKRHFHGTVFYAGIRNLLTQLGRSKYADDRFLRVRTNLVRMK